MPISREVFLEVCQMVIDLWHGDEVSTLRFEDILQENGIEMDADCVLTDVLTQTE